MKNPFMNAGVVPFVALTTLALAGSCSVVLDTEQKQCAKDGDCGTYEGMPTYECVQNFCRRVACADDQECAARGNFVCEERYCREAFCTDAEECAEGTETCVAGRCVDPIFHCFDDTVPLTSEEPAVLRFQVIAYADKKALRELKVDVCSIADTPCNTPLDVARTYDQKTGDLEIRGLENGSRYSIRLKGTAADGTQLLETEYYMQRPVLGLTEEADRFELVPAYLINALSASADTVWDMKKGLVIAEIFGCDNKPLAGVSIASNRAGTLFYLTGTPNPNATETDSLGQGGFVNMEAGENAQPLLHKLTFSYENRNMFSFSVPPRPGVLTFLNIYMPDYRTTSDRASAIER